MKELDSDAGEESELFKKISSLALAFVIAAGVIGEIPTVARGDGDVAYRVENGNIYFDGATGTVTDCDDTVTAAEIPGEIEGVAVKAIGEEAFYNCAELTRVEMPSVVSIGSRAFYDCAALTSVEMPNVESIGGWSFEFCGSLSEVKLPKSVVNIGKGAFWYCYNLKEIAVDGENPSFTSVDNVLFDKNMTEIIQYPQGKEDAVYTTPQSVAGIDEGAFSYNRLLTEVKMPNVLNIGDSAFTHCDALKSADAPKAESVGDAAFEYCGKLEKIELPNAANIGNAAFEFCSSLKALKAPNAVKIGKSALKNCSSLEKIEIPKAGEIGNEAFAYCTALKSVETPRTTTIGEYAFYYCRALSGVHLPKTLKSVGGRAFGECPALNAVDYEGQESDKAQISIDKETNYTFLNEVEWRYNVKFSSDDKYLYAMEGYVRSGDFYAVKGEIENPDGARPKAFYKNVVSSDTAIQSDYIVRDCALEIADGAEIDVSGKITVENAEMTIYGRAKAAKIEIKNGGRVKIFGELETGDLRADGKAGSGTLLEIVGNAKAGDIEIKGYSEIHVSGKLSADNFAISTKNSGSRFENGGELWLSGDFSQGTDGVPTFENGAGNFKAEKGFSVLLLPNPNGHRLNFETPEDSYLYNLYTIGGAENRWEGNAEIKGALRVAERTDGEYGYALSVYDASGVLEFARQAADEMKSAAKRDIMADNPGIEELGGKNSAANEALEKYLAAYVAARELERGAQGNENTWREKVGVWYNGEFKEVRLRFKYSDDKTAVEAEYINAASSEPKRCFTFAAGENSALSGVLKKYSDGKYDVSAAKYMNTSVEQYAKERSGYLAKILKSAVGEMETEPDGGKKYVKDFFENGADGSFEYGVKTAYTETHESGAAVEAFESGEAFSDEYFARAMKKALGTDTLDDETLKNVTTLDLSNSYITDISGIEKCVNLEELNLEGNAVSGIGALKGLTKLKSLNLDGNSVSDITPLGSLTELKELRLKSNFVSDAGALGNLVSLETLDISFNMIQGVSWARTLSRLTELNITGNAVSTLSGLDGATELKTLWAGKNPLSSLSGIENLELENLSIMRDKIADISKLNVSKLRFFDAKENGLENIDVLENALLLEELDISENPVARIDRLSKLPIKTLKMDGCGVKDIDALKGASGLESLSCAYCGITDFEAIRTLSGLEKLDISGNYIWDFSFVSGLTKLNELHAEKCGLCGEERVCAAKLGEVSDTLEKALFEPSLIYFAKDSLDMTFGESADLKVFAIPYNAYVGDLVWKSSDTNVAEASGGKVTAKGTGSAIITAESADGLKAELTLNVARQMIYDVEYSDGKVLATVENTGGEDKGEVDAIIAVYDGEKLIDVKRETILGFTPGYKKTIEAEVKDGSEVKIFLWKGSEPICHWAEAGKK